MRDCAEHATEIYWTHEQLHVLIPFSLVSYHLVTRNLFDRISGLLMMDNLLFQRTFTLSN